VNLKQVEVKENETAVDNLFIFTIMEINEEIDESKTESELREIERNNENESDILIGEIENHFNSENYEEVIKALNLIKYRERISLRVREKLESMNIYD